VASPIRPPLQKAGETEILRPAKKNAGSQDDKNCDSLADWAVRRCFCGPRDRRKSV
jgi:hypothetical protein